jgi:UDP-N-acetylglucosamine--N-acetylmuramyl-(pentapeptide) pyrophosphoryl-undecaprenol N-acetylglucosamine transferase
MNDTPLLVIAAGGTGGHMFPAQALAEEMLNRGWRVKLATDERGARYAGGFPEAVERTVLPSGSFSQGELKDRAAVPFKIVSGVWGAIQSMRSDRPACVAGFGGYPTIPAMTAATLLKIPRLIHEQNGVLGRVNKLFVSRVNAVACGTWPTELPPGTEAFHIGNPVRAGIRQRENAPYISPGDWPMNLLVIGGSQGASVFSEVVPQAVGALPERLRDNLTIQHQARTSDIDAVTEAYALAGVRAEIKPFFDDIDERLVKAQLVISRAGASSIADISVIGRPSILIPYPYATNDHQTANAKGLVDAGGAFVIDEATLSPEKLAGYIEAIVGEPQGANAMVKAAVSYARPAATEMLADLVGKLAFEGNPQ